MVSDREIIIYVVAATVILLVIAILLLILLFQRRRQRVMLLMSLAQEEANRRRRKRKKNGLRRWEIDMVCPEALVARITSTVPIPTLHSLHEHPHQYNTALATLRAASLLPQVSPCEHEVPAPPPAVALSPLSSDIVSDATATDAAVDFVPEDPPPKPEIPFHVAVLPSTCEICVICLEQIELGQKVRVLPCFHLYHSQCIRLWLRRRNACPCCSEKVIKRRSSKHERSLTLQVVSGQPSHILVPLDTPSPTHAASEQSTSVEPIALQRNDDLQTDGSRTDGTLTPSNTRHGDQFDSQNDSANRPGKPPFPSIHFPPSPSSADMRDDISSDIIVSEVSSHVGDEPTAAELVFQTRHTIRGDSLLSFNASTTDLSDVPLSDYPDLRISTTSDLQATITLPSSTTSLVPDDEALNQDT